GHREDALVSLERRGDREPDARVSARAFDHGAAGLDFPFPLGPLDDGQAEAIFHAAARIEKLGLAVDGRRDAVRHPVEPDERRPSNGLQDVVVRQPVALACDRGRRDRGGRGGSGHGERCWAECAVSCSTVSPGSGGMSGRRKNTGRRIEMLIGWPCSIAGRKRSDCEPLTAAESSAGYPDDSTTVVDSGATLPVESMRIRNVTLACTRCL